MPKEKFNPIAQIPNLPGANIQELSDIIAKDMETHTVPPKYPPTEVPDKDLDTKPQIEIRLKPPVSKEEVVVTKDVKKEERDNLMIIRTIILIGLIILILAGIFLTLRLVPKIVSKISQSSQSFSSLFTTKKPAALVPVDTTDETPEFVPPFVAPNNPSAPKPPVAPVTPTTPVKPVTQPTTEPSTPVAKTPAKLTVNVISATNVGDRTYVKFNVQNVGGTPSGTWSFKATMPSRVTPTYSSVLQSSISPQSGIIYTLGFARDPYQNTPVQITLYTNNGTVVNY